MPSCLDYQRIIEFILLHNTCESLTKLIWCPQFVTFCLNPNIYWIILVNLEFGGKMHYRPLPSVACINILHCCWFIIVPLYKKCLFGGGGGGGELKMTHRENIVKKCLNSKKKLTAFNLIIYSHYLKHINDFFRNDVTKI